MLSYILVLCGVLIFIRLYLNKFEIEHKDIIAIALSVVLTTFLSLIQFIVECLLKLIR